MAAVSAASAPSRYTFTHQWFLRSNMHAHRWLEGLWSADAPLKMLEIGAFEGLCSTYLVDHFLGHEDSRLVCVDPFSTADSTTPVTSETEVRFRTNVARCAHPAKVSLVKAFSKDFYPTNTESFDFIYIDGSHLVEDLVLDMNACHSICKPGGYILLDDYRGASDTLKPHMDSFVAAHEDLEIVHVDYQMLLRKKVE